MIIVKVHFDSITFYVSVGIKMIICVMLILQLKTKVKMENLTMGSYEENKMYDFDLEKYGTILKELDIPKIILDLIFCVLVLAMVIATMVRKCKKRREEELEASRRVRFMRPDELSVEMGRRSGRSSGRSLGRGRNGY